MKKINLIKSLAVLLTLSTSAFIFSSCDKEEATTPAAAEAKALIIHASPDAPTVNITLDGTVVSALGDLSFPKFTSSYATLPADKDIKVGLRTIGGTTDAFSKTVKLAKDKNYSIFAINRLASIDFLAFEDDLTAPTGTNAKVRFIHLSPDAPAVDINAKGSTNKLFANAAFKSGSVVEVPAGTYELEVKAAGTTTVALSVPGVKVDAGKIYTIFAHGLLAATGTQPRLSASIIVNK
jgi:hypothetical protein